MHQYATPLALAPSPAPSHPKQLNPEGQFRDHQALPCVPERPPCAEHLLQGLQLSCRTSPVRLATCCGRSAQHPPRVTARTTPWPQPLATTPSTPTPWLRCPSATALNPARCMGACYPGTPHSWLRSTGTQRHDLTLTPSAACSDARHPCWCVHVPLPKQLYLDQSWCELRCMSLPLLGRPRRLLLDARLREALAQHTQHLLHLHALGRS